MFVLSSCGSDSAPSAPSGTATYTPTFTPTFTSTVNYTRTAEVIATQTAVAELSYTEMVSVSGGAFVQEDTSGNSFSHTISAYKIGKYEVTYELWYEVYQWALLNDYFFQNTGREGNYASVDGSAPGAAKYEPVTLISWRDIIVWCNAYSEMTGLTPVYYTDAVFESVLKDSRDGSYAAGINTAPGSFDNPYINENADGYRLPSEGEWQYAARYIDGSSWQPVSYASGAAADYFDNTETAKAAWYDYNSLMTTHDTGLKAPNALGLYDMSGNVYEFCRDWYGDYPGASSDYTGPDSGQNRIMYGGAYNYYSHYLRCGRRDSVQPYFEGHMTGFRLSRN